MSKVAHQSPIKIAVVGVGKIVRDQHLPSIADNPCFELVAAASRNARVDGIDNYPDIDRLLAARADVDAVALCMPPQFRFTAARAALAAGKHVLLEKPPGASVSEVQLLQKMAEACNLSLYVTWHSRYAAAVGAAREWLSGAEIQSVTLRWHENVRKWHPGQQWIWRAGGLGVFDSGINALSILTEILPMPAYLTAAELYFPSNQQAPIAAQLEMQSGAAQIQASFDWRTTGDEDWTIHCHTDRGELVLKEGGALLKVDGVFHTHATVSEYAQIYQVFVELIDGGAREVDLSPLQLTADAFLLARRSEVAAFDS